MVKVKEISFIIKEDSPNIETSSAMLKTKDIAKSTYVYISYQIVK